MWKWFKGCKTTEHGKLLKEFGCQKGENRMKITMESWLKATAKAMSTEASKKLFSSDSQIKSLFIDYSFHLYTKLKGKTITESEYNKIVADIHVETLSETEVNFMLNITIDLTLIIFAVQIWQNLTDQPAEDEMNTEYNNFKSALKSQNFE